MMPPSFPHPPDPMVLMMGIIMLMALVATLVRDEEEWQRQAAIMPEHGMLSKKITGPPFHGSMITCSKESSEFQGRLLRSF